MAKYATWKQENNKHILSFNGNKEYILFCNELIPNNGLSFMQTRENGLFLRHGIKTLRWDNNNLLLDGETVGEIAKTINNCFRCYSGEKLLSTYLSLDKAREFLEKYFQGEYGSIRDSKSCAPEAVSPKAYWYVIGFMVLSFNFRYETREAAFEEAKRLSQIYTNQDYEILMAQCVVNTHAVNTTKITNLV